MAAVSDTTQQTYLFALPGECQISKSQPIVTGSFGDDYVLTGYDKESKYSFVARLTKTTNSESLSQIFKRLQELGVETKKLQVGLMGGWVHGCGLNSTKIITLLDNESVYSGCNFKFFEQKAVHDYFPGGMMDPSKGSFSFFKQPWAKAEEKQEAAMKTWNSIGREKKNLYDLGIFVARA